MAIHHSIAESGCGVKSVTSVLIRIILNVPLNHEVTLVKLGLH